MDVWGRGGSPWLELELACPKEKAPSLKDSASALGSARQTIGSDARHRAHAPGRTAATVPLF